MGVTSNPGFFVSFDFYATFWNVTMAPFVAKGLIFMNSQ